MGTRVLSLVGTLLLTRFLAPEVQGEVTAAYILVLTPHWTTSPLVQYLVAHPDAKEDVAWHVTVAHLGIGFAATLLAVLAAPFFGTLLHAPEMARYAPGFGVALALERVGQLAERVVARELRFRPIAAARGASELGYSVTAIVTAALGAGGHAIVLGNVARGLLYAGLLVRASTRRVYLTPHPLRRATFRPIFAYGLPLWVSYLSVIVSRRWDNIVVTRFFGPADAGLYNLAYNLADVPAIQVAEQIGDVFMPSLGHLSLEDKKAAVVRVAGLLALVVFPLAVGLGAVAPTVALVFNEKWRGVAPMLAILAGMSITRPIAVSVVQSYLQATSRTRASMALGFLQIALLMGGLFTIGRISPLWACAAVGIAFALFTAASLFVVWAYDRVPVGRLALRCVPPLLATVPMVLAVRSVRGLLLPWHPPVALELAAEVAAGGVGYVIAAFLIARPLAAELIETIRDARRRRHEG